MSQYSGLPYANKKMFPVIKSLRQFEESGIKNGEKPFGTLVSGLGGDGKSRDLFKQQGIYQEK